MRKIKWKVVHHYCKNYANSAFAGQDTQQRICSKLMGNLHEGIMFVKMRLAASKANPVLRAYFCASSI